ncbi:MAG: acyloxyacyl hydrolase, partial [Myxococcota bacterium]
MPRADEGTARFEKGAEEWGLSIGLGLGLGIWGSDNKDAQDVRFVSLVPSYGIGLSDPVAADSWYHGNLELLVEGALSVAYGPKGGFIGGAGIALRYNLLAWRHLVPFVELGAGLAYLELDLDSQSDGLSFTPQGGLGVHWWLSPRASLTASWRLHHVSNAGIGDDNAGINDS